MRITADGGIGIGTTNPYVLNEPAKFNEVVIGGKSEGAAITLRDDNGNVQGNLFTSDATGAMIIRTITNHPMMFRTNNTDIARFDSGGRLLLKTTTEGHAAADDLTIENTTQDMGMTLRSSSSHQGAIYFSDGTSGADEYRGIITYNHANDKLSVYTNASAALHITSSGDIDVGTAATIKANGNATFSGIVTATKLQVHSATNTAAEFRGSGGAGFISIKDGDDGTLAFIGVDGGAIKLQTSGSSYSDKLVIATDGKIGVGLASPVTAMHIANTDDPVTITLQNTDSNTPTDSGGEILFKGTKTNGDPLLFGGVGGRRRAQSSDESGYLALYRQNGDGSNAAVEAIRLRHSGDTVSYTHLTLPTKRIV